MPASAECPEQRKLRQRYVAALRAYREAVPTRDAVSTRREFDEAYERAEVVRLSYLSARFELCYHLERHGCAAIEQGIRLVVDLPATGNTNDALFIILSAYVAVIVLLIAAGPAWAWIQLWRKEWRERRRRIEEFRASPGGWPSILRLLPPPRRRHK